MSETTRDNIIDLMNENTCFKVEIECLHTEQQQLLQAFGLLSTLKPDMEIDIEDPIGMAHQIVAHVANEIERLREEAKDRSDLADEAMQLVHEQEAEIDRLQTENSRLVVVESNLVEEIERLRVKVKEWSGLAIDHITVIGQLHTETDNLVEQLAACRSRHELQRIEVEELRKAHEACSWQLRNVLDSRDARDAKIGKLRGMLEECWLFEHKYPVGVGSDLWDRVAEEINIPAPGFE